MSISLEPVPDFTVSSTVHSVATLAAGVVWLGVLAGAILVGRRHHSPIPLLFMAGGAATVGFEPIVDTLGKCYLPAEFQWTLFTVLGRPMPVYAILVYSAFFGGFAIMSWNHLRSGGEPQGLWRKYAIAIGINTFLFETPAVSIFHVYTYYGEQPFNFWGFPLWWPFVNTAGPLAAGALVFALERYMRLRPRHLLPLAFVLVPMADGMSNGASAYPTWMALNANIPVWLVWCAGGLTVALATLEVHGVVSMAQRLERSSAPQAARAAATTA
jgi:hypothetical protein